MRKDFAHVYTDGSNGPRYPYGVSSRHPIRDEDGAPIAVGRHYAEHRLGWRESDNTHGSLIERYLGSCIGRRWDDVLSEAAAAVRGDGLAHDILRALRAEWRVDRSCVWIDGELRDPRGFVVNGFYVDPADGTLRRAGPVDRRGWATRRRLKPFLDGDLLPLHEEGADAKAVFERVGGCWFHRVWREIPAFVGAREAYRLAQFSRKRQLSRKEVARLRLEEWRSLAGALDASVANRSYDAGVLRRMEAIRTAAVRSAR